MTIQVVLLLFVTHEFFSLVNLHLTQHLVHLVQVTSLQGLAHLGRETLKDLPCFLLLRVLAVCRRHLNLDNRARLHSMQLDLLDPFALAFLGSFGYDLPRTGSDLHPSLLHILVEYILCLVSFGGDALKEKPHSIFAKGSAVLQKQCLVHQLSRQLILVLESSIKGLHEKSISLLLNQKLRVL
ncbi:hypothetical protein HG530_003367 [Fusarium avenaceum]|nr:hypothetical protein HG530_003367 [Fusarium avenaceum]